ncbi:formyl transferase domain protein [Leptothrix cholodnii SP-6]|uniref:Formyl transferase domain protein n=1 Tax=Leptothrix cholodnii (strain ATCC 51168 / LMG 8142 / SP-6) TaxID=395495 RepID=B1Y5K3_LEPCP|nr:enoyl-CoA hydratase-related protein [Leptothrix cholodnii]ACB34715.1 formyl transferase domain protein [Leptothrix cholodnii SP-6]
MRILLLAHAFNGLTQRLFCALREAGHTVSVELDIADAVTEEAVALFEPDLVIAPFLKRRIAESVWSTRPCLIVHPGPPGDGGPASLDWAVWRGEAEWGVTVLQATGDFDAGPVWAWRAFAVREGASKASLYRHEVTRCATESVLEALTRFAPGTRGPVPPPSLPATLGQWQGPMTAAMRAIDWSADDTATVLRKIAAADGHPGAPDVLFGRVCRLHDAHAASAGALAAVPHGAPGDVIARRGPALLRRTRDGGVWIGHVRCQPLADEPALKLAATRAFAAETAALPELAVPLLRKPDEPDEWDELHYDELGPAGARVGWLRFDFHNGAMSTRQCERLRDALRFARARDTQVLVLAGGSDFFSNGIHLHDIEASAHDAGDSAADASMRNIVAMNDVVLELLTLTDRLTVALLQGNAGAGGCFLAFAADTVWAHAGVVLNPHYKNMGNLYGSEYWTYTLPLRAGAAQADALTRRVMQGRLPMSAHEARSLGLVDAVLADDAAALRNTAQQAALTLAAAHDLAERVAAKQRRRADDESRRPLAAWRDDELRQMHRNFYGFDPSYHVARHHFVTRKPRAWTPRHLALHRRPGPR